VNNYCTINDKTYRVLVRDYAHELEPQKVVRDGVLGNDIVTVGPADPRRVVRAILWVPYEPEDPAGGLVDLVAALKEPTVVYIDNETNESFDGGGTYDISLLRMRRMHLPGSPRPEPGYWAAIEWQVIRPVPEGA
jgi:hypothetical protein